MTIVTLKELYNNLAQVFDVILYEDSVLAKKFSLTSWKDQDGYEHVIFIETEKYNNDEDYRRRFRECLDLFYRNTFGIGYLCSETTALEKKHSILDMTAEGVVGKIDFITVVSFLKVTHHCNNTFLMRLLCRWLYTES